MNKKILALAINIVLGIHIVYADYAQEVESKKLQYQQSLASNPDDAISLNNLAAIYFAQGQYDQAEPLFQRSLVVMKKTLGNEHPSIATSLNNLAEIYRIQGKHDQAKPLYENSLEMREKILGSYHPDVAQSLNNLAILYWTQGNYLLAEQLYQRSLVVLEKSLSKNHPDFSNVLNNLAELYQDQAKYRHAELLLQQSLAIREKVMGNDHPDVAQSLNNLAALYCKQGKYTEAEPLYQRSLVIRENALGKDHPAVAISLNNLAELHYNKGRYEQAETLFKRSLQIREMALGNYHLDVAVSLNNLAALYWKQGKYTEAEPLYQRSLVIRENALGKDHPDVAQSLNNLAALYCTQGKYTEAEQLYQRSLVIWEKTLGKDNPDFASGLNNLAGLYKIMGKYAEAEPIYNYSLSVWEKVLGDYHPDVGLSLDNLAQLYRLQGKFDQAELLYKRSLNIFEKSFGNNHPDVTISLNDLAEIYNFQGKYDKAEILLQRSLRIINQSLDHWLWGAGEKTRQSYLKQQERLRNVYLSFYSLRNTPEEALYYSLSRKGLLLRISSEVSALAKQSPDPVIQQQKQQFNALRTQLSTLLFSGKADKAQIAALEAQSEELERQLSQHLSGFKRSQTEITPTQVLEKLSEGQSLVDFLVYKAVDLKTNKTTSVQIMALVADKSHGVQLVKLGDFAPIAEAIKAYRSAIKPSADSDKTRSLAAQSLYQQLWQPLTPFLQNTRTVYVVPDGMLHLLPFKALQDSAGAYLAEKQQLVTLSSARDIVLPPIGNPTRSAAIFAGPDYGDTRTDANTKSRGVDLKEVYFGALPGALAEGQQIDKLFGKMKSLSSAGLFVKDQASEQQITAINSPKILHLATHGFFLEDVVVKEDPNALNRSFMVTGLNKSLAPATPNEPIENPLARSGLAFANANFGLQGIKQADNTDGILTALEVLNLNLEGTDLVTLSACETGVGEVKVGEGVYSLNRAFQEAGAKAVLSTLWQVDDEGTQKFMQKFYQRFLDGKPAQQAIQETQSEFIHDKDYSSPYYWAGFVMMGKE